MFSFLRFGYFVLRRFWEPDLKVVFLIITVESFVRSVFCLVLFEHEIFKLIKLCVFDGPRELMSFVELNNLCVCFVMKQLVNCHILLELIFRSLQVNRGEVKLLSQSLSVFFVLISEAHLREDRRCNWNHEPGHLESLSAIRCTWESKGLRVDFLRDPVEMPEDDTALWET